jgi:hypothetical protein
VEENLSKIFKRAVYNPEGRLSGDIFRFIEYKQAQIIKWKRFGYLSLSVLSLSGSVLSIKVLIEQSVSLGFFRYLSLAFSDSGVIALYWKEYILSLADSLPIASTIASLFLLLVLFISVKRTYNQFKSKLSII